MRVKYGKHQIKGNRILKGTIYSKTLKKRLSLFCGLNMIYNPDYDNEILYWCEGISKWCTWDEWEDVGTGNLSSNKHGFNSVRSAINHLKKHTKYLPKGSVFKLDSRWDGYEVEITI